MKYKNYDDYINSSETFAHPILEHLRKCVHEACPEVVEEFKWSMPCFTYKGTILCNMAAFKKHTSFGFWLAPKMTDPEKVFVHGESRGLGHFGKITTLEDLPEKSILISYILEAVQLINNGEKISGTAGRKAKVFEEPDYFMYRIEANPNALSTYKSFSQSHKNEYIEWITDAKTEKTREKRLDQMIEWLQEGKPKNWKYMKNSKWN